jgi:hypothetical protein
MRPSAPSGVARGHLGQGDAPTEVERLSLEILPTTGALQL